MLWSSGLRAGLCLAGVLFLTSCGTKSSGTSGGQPDQVRSRSEAPQAGSKVIPLTHVRDVDTNIRAWNHRCANDGLSAMEVPSDYREVALGSEDSENENWEYAEGRLLLVSANPNGDHAVVLLNDAPDGQGDYRLSTVCESISQSSSGPQFSVSGTLTAPLRTESQSDGIASTSVGERKIRIAKEMSSSQFVIEQIVDRQKRQHVSKSDAAAAAELLRNHPKISVRAFRSQNGMIIVMRLAPRDDKKPNLENLTAQVFRIHMRKTL